MLWALMNVGIDIFYRGLSLPRDDNNVMVGE